MDCRFWLAGLILCRCTGTILDFAVQYSVRFFDFTQLFDLFQSLKERRASPGGALLTSHRKIYCLLHMLGCFLDYTLNQAVVFVFVVLLLYWFSISSSSLLDIESCDLLSLIAHKDNNYQCLVISIWAELLLLIVNNYRFLLVQLLCLFSVIPGSSISMLLNSLFCCSTYFSVEGNVYTLALVRLW